MANRGVGHPRAVIRCMPRSWPRGDRRGPGRRAWPPCGASTRPNLRVIAGTGSAWRRSRWTDIGFVVQLGLATSAAVFADPGQSTGWPSW